MIAPIAFQAEPTKIAIVHRHANERIVVSSVRVRVKNVQTRCQSLCPPRPAVMSDV
jgi:hypothetical protein